MDNLPPLQTYAPPRSRLAIARAPRLGPFACACGALAWVLLEFEPVSLVVALLGVVLAIAGIRKDQSKAAANVGLVINLLALMASSRFLEEIGRLGYVLVLFVFGVLGGFGR